MHSDNSEIRALQKDSDVSGGFLSAPEQFVDKKVLVKGMIVEVCAKRGCWMDLASDKAFETIQIKVLDGVIVFPMSARGKEALVEGLVEALKYSKEDAIAWLQHQAEEKGESFDPKSVTSGISQELITKEAEMCRAIITLIPYNYFL